jgi:predicted RNA-binding protein associated with RNAse of E/G family
MEDFIFTVIFNVLKIHAMGGSWFVVHENAYKYSLEKILNERQHVVDLYIDSRIILEWF